MKAYTPVTVTELQNVAADESELVNDELIDELLTKVEENRIEEIKQAPIVEYRERTEEVGAGELIFPGSNARDRRSSSADSRSPERSRSRSRHHHSHSRGTHHSRSRSYEDSHGRSRKNRHCRSGFS